ncbi:hypothetical protein MKQ70_07535 [Chitinophaga sedimenti]|uniref:hypothetical protein n=1 Tax=Chitinophaga sedimenti TaxID=2033606 RepID=UPI002003F9DF|nr:hypothetical protein [Chitinophaga sedimenti]MCK7554862.1 hypothetical protein [Chitinophaga sedimenti]
MKYLFLLLLLTGGCFTLRGQTNGPVRSNDYEELVRQQAAQRTGDTVFGLNPVGRSPLRVLNEYDLYMGMVKSVQYTDSSLYVQPWYGSNSASVLLTRPPGSNVTSTASPRYSKLMPRAATIPGVGPKRGVIQLRPVVADAFLRWRPL